MPDNGYYYGIGAFETMAVEQGTVEYLDEHLTRLQKALAFFQIPSTVQELKQKILYFLEMHASDLTGHDVLKLAVSPTESHLTLRPNTYTSEQYQKGFQVEFSKILRNETSPLTYHKTLCYAENLLEKQRIVAEGKDEVLFLNTKGEITEGSTSNIFFVKEGKLYTPPVSCGLLPGIMRAAVCQRYDVTEKIIRPEDIKQYDSAFLTNSLMKIMPVVSIAQLLPKSS